MKQPFGNIRHLKMEPSEDPWVLVSSFVKLPPDFEVNRDSVNIIDISSPEFDRVKNQISNADVVLKHLLRRGQQSILLERYFQDGWVRWDLQKLPVLDNVGHGIPNYKRQASNHYDFKTLDEWSQLKIEAIFPYWKEDEHRIPDGDLYEQLPLIMKPPKLSNRTEDKSMEKDPVAYVKKKYYEILYSLNIPLAHFVKSKLSRTKVLCKQQGSEYKDVLRSVLVDLSGFDTRYTVDHNGLLNYDDIPEECKTFRKEIIQETLNVDNNVLSKNKDVTTDIASILKVRDIKLQIIILLEIISENNLDGSMKQYEANYENKLSERSLNMVTAVTRFSRRRKKSKADAPKIAKATSAVDYCQHMDILLDKLGIAEALISTEISMQSEQPPANKSIHEYKRGIVDKNKEMSSKGFLGYVVIPYWYKKLPFVVTFISNKIKGPRIENKVPKGNNSSNSASNYNQLRSSSVTSNTSDRSTSPQVPPLLRTRTNSNLIDFLEGETTKKKPTLASRSSSDIKLNHLEKRQMSVQDLSLDEIMKQKQQVLQEFSAVRSVLVNGKSVSFTQSHSNSFQRVGKRKIDSTTLPKTDEKSEDDIHVTATPMKPDEEIKISPIFVASPAVANTNMKSPVKESPIKNKPKRVRRRLFAP